MNYVNNLDFRQKSYYKIKQSKIFKKELTESINYIKEDLYNPRAAKRLLDKIEKETENLSYSARAYLLHIFNSRKSYLKKFKSKIQLKIIV